MRLFWLLPNRRFLFRQCSVLGRSCWRHPPFRTSTVPDERVAGKFRSGLRRWRSVRGPRRQREVRACRIRFLWRRDKHYNYNFNFLLLFLFLLWKNENIMWSYTRNKKWDKVNIWNDFLTFFVSKRFISTNNRKYFLRQFKIIFPSVAHKIYLFTISTIYYLLF